jgi:hypothetical protein
MHLPMPMQFPIVQQFFQNMSLHQKQDIAYYLAFLIGQLLFLLKRASSAIRSKSNPIKSRRAFFAQNWDILSIRVALEAAIFVLVRHVGLSDLIAMFTNWKMPIQLPQSGFGFGCMGYAVDSVVDWFAVSSKCPALLQRWIKENIPDVQVYESHTVQTGTDSTGAPVTVEKTVTVEKIVPPNEPTS